MDLKYPNIQDNYPNSKIFFQKNYTLPLEDYCIRDSEITINHVKKKFEEFISRSAFLLQTQEEAIEFGTLQEWGIYLSKRALDAFIDAGRSHSYEQHNQLEEQLSDSLNLLADIQNIFTKAVYANITKKNMIAFSFDLLNRDKNVMEAIFFSETWKLHYAIFKYIFSIQAYECSFEQGSKTIKESLYQNFRYYIKTFIDRFRYEYTMLTLGNFLPSYFDNVSIERAFHYTVLTPLSFIPNLLQSCQTAATRNEQKDTTKQDFLFYEVISQYEGIDNNFTEVFHENIIQELFDRKLALTKQDSFEDMMYLALSLLYASNNCAGQLIMCNDLSDFIYVQGLSKTLYFLTETGFNSQRENFLDILIPNVTLATYPSSVEMDNDELAPHYKLFIELLAKNSTGSKNYLNRMSTLKGWILTMSKILQSRDTLPNFFNKSEESKLSKKVKSTLKLTSEAFDILLARISTESLIANNFIDIPLLLVIYQNINEAKINNIIRNTIAELFELKELPNGQTVNYNMVGLLLSELNLNNGSFEKILKIKGYSIVEKSILDYLHKYYIELDCPLSTFFTISCLIEIIYKFEYTTLESTLKGLFIIQKFIRNDFLNLQVTSKLYLSTIFKKLTTAVNKFAPEKTRELNSLIIKWHLMRCKGLEIYSKDSCLQDAREFLDIYECDHSTEIAEISENAKTTSLEMFSKYPLTEFAVSRAFSSFRASQSNHLSTSLFQVISPYFQELTEKQKKTQWYPKKDFEKLIMYSIQNTSAFYVATKQLLLSIRNCFFQSANTLVVDNGKSSVPGKNYNENTIEFCALECISDFLTTNMEVLIARQSNALPMYAATPMECTVSNYILSRSLSITSPTTYDEACAISRLGFILHLGNTLIRSFQRGDLHPNENLARIVKEIQQKLFAIFDINALANTIGAKNFKLFRTAQPSHLGFELARLLDSNKLRSLQSLFTPAIQSKDILKLRNPDEMPKFFINHLWKLCDSTGAAPEILSDRLHEFQKRYRFDKSLPLTYESFFKMLAMYNYYRKFFHLDVALDCQFQIMTNIQKYSSHSENKQQNERSKLFYYADFDVLLSELVVFQEFLLNFLKHEQMDLDIINKENQDPLGFAFMRQLVPLVKSMKNLGTSLLFLAYGKNEKYQRSKENVAMINEFICNVQAIAAQLNRIKELKFSYFNSILMNFLEKFKEAIKERQLVNQNHINEAVADFQLICEQFGDFYALFLRKIVLENHMTLPLCDSMISLILQIDSLIVSWYESQNKKDESSEGAEVKEKKIQRQNSLGLESECLVIASSHVMNLLLAFLSQSDDLSQLYFNVEATFAEIQAISQSQQSSKKVIEQFGIMKFLERAFSPSKFSDFLPQNNGNNLNARKNPSTSRKAVLALFASLKPMVFYLLEQLSSKNEDFRCLLGQQEKTSFLKLPFCLIKNALIEADSHFKEETQSRGAVEDLSDLLSDAAVQVGFGEIQENDIDFLYDFCLGIIQKVIEVTKSCLEKGYQVAFDSLYFKQLNNDLVEKSFDIMQKLIHSARDVQLDRLEEMIQTMVSMHSYFPCKDFSSKTWQKESLSFYLNFIFLERGRQSAKDFIRKKIARKICEDITDFKEKDLNEMGKNVAPSGQGEPELKIDEGKLVGKESYEDEEGEEAEEHECNKEVAAVERKEKKRLEIYGIQKEEYASDSQSNQSRSRTNSSKNDEGSNSQEENQEEEEEKEDSDSKEEDEEGESVDNDEEEDEDEEYNEDEEEENSDDARSYLGGDNDGEYENQNSEDEIDKVDASEDDQIYQKESDQFERQIKGQQFPAEKQEYKSNQSISSKAAKKLNEQEELKILSEVQFSNDEIEQKLIKKLDTTFVFHPNLLVEVLEELFEPILLENNENGSLFKLSNPRNVLELSHQEDKFIHISQGQKEFFKKIIDTYVIKILTSQYDLDNNLRTVNSQQEIFIEHVTFQNEKMWVSMGCIKRNLVSLIQSYPEILVPYFCELRLHAEAVEMLTSNNNLDTFALFKGDSLTDFLIMASISTKYENQELLFAIIEISQSLPNGQELQQKIIRHFLFKSLAILETFLKQPDFLREVKYLICFNGVLDFFKNIVTMISQLTLEERKLIETIFELFLNRAETFIEFKQVMCLEGVHIYFNTMKKNISMIFGENFNPNDLLKTTANIFFEFFTEKPAVEAGEGEKSQKIESKGMNITLRDCEHSVTFEEDQFYNSQEKYLGKIDKKDSKKQHDNVLNHTSSSQSSNGSFKRQKVLSEIIWKTNVIYQSKGLNEQITHNDIDSFKDLFKIIERNRNEFVQCKQFPSMHSLLQLNCQRNETGQLNYLSNTFFAANLAFLLNEKEIENKKENEHQESRSKKEIDYQSLSMTILSPLKEIILHRESSKLSQNNMNELLSDPLNKQVDCSDKKKGLTDGVEGGKKEKEEEQMRVRTELVTEKEEVKIEREKIMEEVISKNKNPEINEEEEKRALKEKRIKELEALLIQFEIDLNELSKYDLTIEQLLLESSSHNQRILLFDAKQKYSAKENLRKKLEIIEYRERMKVLEALENKELGIDNQEELNRVRQLFKSHMSKKEIVKSISKLSKRTLRSLLITDDHEFKDLLNDRLKEKSKEFTMQQAAIQLWKERAEVTDEKQRETLILNHNSLVWKKMNTIDQMNYQQNPNQAIIDPISFKGNSELNDKQRESLSLKEKIDLIPLIPESIAIRIIVMFLIHRDIDSVLIEFWEHIFINPKNYVRFFGLVMLFARKIANKQLFGITWLNAIFSPSNNQRFFSDPNFKPYKSDETRMQQNLLTRLGQLVSELLDLKGLAFNLFLMEKLPFAKNKIEKLEFFEEHSNKFGEHNSSVLRYNLFKDSHLRGVSKSISNLNFESCASPLLLENAKDMYVTFDEYLNDMSEQIQKPTKQAESKFQEQLRTTITAYEQHTQFQYLSQANQLLEIITKLVVQKYTNIVRYTLISKEKPKTEVTELRFDQDDQKNNKVPSDHRILVDKNNYMIVINASKPDTETIMNVVQTVLKEIVFFGIDPSEFKSIRRLLQILADLNVRQLNEALNQAVAENTQYINSMAEFLKNHFRNIEYNLSEFIACNPTDELGISYQEKQVKELTLKMNHIDSFYTMFDENFQMIISYNKQFKRFAKWRELPLDRIMYNYAKEYAEMAEHKGEIAAKNWWNKKYQFEQSAIVDEIKEEWLRGDSEMIAFFTNYFEFTHLNMKLNPSFASNFHSIYLSIVPGLQAFLDIDSTYFNPVKQSLEHRTMRRYEEEEESKENEKKRAFDEEVEEEQNGERNPTVFPELSPVFLKPDDEYEEMMENTSSEQLALKAQKIFSLIVQRRDSNTLSEIPASQIMEELRGVFFNTFQKIICELVDQNHSKIIQALIQNLVHFLSSFSFEFKDTFIKTLAKKENMLRQNENKNLRIHCTIDRQELWHSYIRYVQAYSPTELLTSEIRISFKDEDGYDNGGLIREFFQIVPKDIIDPQKGYFTASLNNGSFKYQPNPLSGINANQLQQFQNAGRFFAKAIMDDFTVDVEFTRSFLKHIVGQKLFLGDLEDIDSELAKNLNWILENDVTELEYDFTYSYFEFNQLRVVELVENGRLVPVTERNKKEYVKLTANYRMTGQIQKQLQAFQQGFYEMIPFSVIRYYSFKELGIKLSGELKIDLEDMREYLVLGEYKWESPQIIWLLEVLSTFSEKELSEFIFFLSGSFRIPYGGFYNFTMYIIKKPDSDRLPIGHTCLQSLELPAYKTKEILEQKLRTAIFDGSLGFYMS